MKKLKNILIGLVAAFLVFVSLRSEKIQAVSSAPAIHIPRDKKFCILEAKVAYSGSNDVLEISTVCDGDDREIFEANKLEKGDDLKMDTKLITKYGRLLISDAGMKLLGCETLPPVNNVRYLTRYSCSFSR